ncbi:hypothetical protein SAMN06295924_104207 [Rathayibacter rathayi NCPPB 2980 = VKM Ac-1601]|nr:hypothetical protein FB469_2446 [Rathayibacter rathayi]SOE04529.1 hypothetical protein SAMN06295924_104207 [Rathayibacter rathayi NCPPB 2980 = VKM Ac-1601]
MADPAALLDAVDSLIGLVTRAEVQLSQVERSVRDDLDRAATLSELRTSAQLASAADVAAACATAQSLLLDADSALEAVVAGYREPRAQAERHPPQTARMP